MTKIFEKENRGVLLNTLLIVILILTFLLTSASFTVQGFEDRVIGNNALENVSLPALAHHFYLSYLFLFPVLLFLTYKLLKKGYSFLNQDFKKFNQAISIFGLISYFFSFLSPHTFSSFLLPIILTGITILSLLLNFLNHKKDTFSSSFYVWTLLLSIPVAIIGTFIMHRLPFFRFSPYTHFIGLYFLSIIIMTVLFKNCNWHRLTKSSTFFLSSIILHPLFLELYNILNQYHIFLPHKGIWIVLLYFLLFLLSVFSYHHFQENKNFNYKKYFYPIVLLGLALIYATNPLVNQVQTDFFESSNHGTSIFELFRFGKIPILETFDAHLLSKQIFGILYGIINHDFQGAIFNIYNSYVIVFITLLLFFIFKKFVGQDIALLSLLVLPFAKDSSLSYFWFALICIFTFLNAIKKQHFSSYLLFFGSLAFSCLYRLDIGFAISMATCLLLLYFIIQNPKDYKVKKIILAFFCIIGSFIALYLSLCLFKHINPITRALEFLKLTLSNSNWAFSTLGYDYSYAYFIFYYILPVLTILSLLYLLTTKPKQEDHQRIILILLALFYLFNFQRGLIRHSLVENTNSYLLSFSILYFSLFSFYLYKKKKFLPSIIYSLLLVFFAMTLNLGYDQYFSLTSLALNKELSYQLEDSGSNKKEERVVLSKKMKKEYQDLKKILSLLLKENETYMDFSNQTLLYALLGYEKPVYVNQSPGLLSGEYTQQLFLKECHSKQVPIVLKAKNKQLATKLDAVPNDYRYYLISEEISQNYSLLTTVNDYEIWIQNERKEEAIEILKKNHLLKESKQLKQKPIVLKYIPYIWGKEKIEEKIQIQLKKEEKSENYTASIPKEIDKSKGNYLILKLQNQTELQSIALKFKNSKNTKQVLEFFVPKGTYTYKIRISAFPSWYFDSIEQLELEKKEGINLVNWSLAEGDTLQ